jgi:uroporphyrinogen III methyltransferase / synthase
MLRKGEHTMNKRKVFLVGAGPGDIQLITVKALEAIKKADVILYDRLANPKLLEFAPSHCELIYCGKLPLKHTLRQENINALLVSKALEGKTVIRLKGGDPGIFGRVGEEAEALATKGIEFEIVPGISSGIAAPLYAGIPVTHREYGETFAVITAHNKSKDGKPLLDWKSLASGIDTIAFYMGVANLPYICENLILHGKPETTPVILIQWGTFGRQKTLEGTLATIAEKVAVENFSNPAITLVGNIVSIREKINWFEKKPLFGRQILLARTGVNPSELAKELTEQGADVYEFPKWKKYNVPVNQDILKSISEYNQILFTSPESVDDFFSILIEQEMDVRTITAKLYGASVKSVNALKQKGLPAQLESELIGSDRLLVVCDNRFENKYTSCDLFRTSEIEIDEQFDQAMELMLKEAVFDTIIFPSSLSVKKLLQEMERTTWIPKSVFWSTEIICMGNNSYQAASDLGINPDRLLENPTKKGLIEAILQKKNLVK